MMSFRYTPTKLLVLQIFLICFNYGQNAEPLTDVPNDYVLSVAGLVDLLQLEAKLIQNINKYEFAYIKNKEKPLLKLFLEKIKIEHKKSQRNPEAYLSNPMNSFSLIRRLQQDWMKFKNFTQKLLGEVQIDLIKGSKIKWPTIKDLKDAAAGIYRIQETYQLNVTSMINGNLNGKQYGTKFSSLDCIEVGNYLNELNNCVPALNWYKAALKLYSSYEDDLHKVFNISRADILYSSADCWLEIGDRNQALKNLELGLELEPKNQALIQMTDEIQQHINHDRLCRGEFSSKMSKFQCHYNSWTTPFLKIAPLKLEEIAFNPYIAVYHDVIFENEISQIKTEVVPSLIRGSTAASKRDRERTTNVYNYAFKSSYEGRKLFARVLDMTGLYFNVESKLQVANYGLGGHFYNHCDFIDDDKDFDFEQFGNRAASVVFFLNDVDQGGETAFPRIHRIVPARTGNAVLIYHLDNAKENNKNSMHASCPVVFGSKWMGITSTFLKANMFMSPCLPDRNNFTKHFLK